MQRVGSVGSVGRLGLSARLMSSAAIIAPAITYAFGALTRAGAGGVNAPAGAASITGGTAAAGFTVTGGKVVASGNASPVAGTLTFNNGATATVVVEASAYSCASEAELAAAAAHAATTPTATLTIRMRSGTYAAAASVTGINMSGTLSGVPQDPPVNGLPQPPRWGEAWDPTYVGGSLRITKDFGADVRFSGGFTLGGTALILENFNIGSLSTVDQFQFEPETRTAPTAIIRGTTTQVVTPVANQFTVGFGMTLQEFTLPGWAGVVGQNFAVLAIDLGTNTVTINLDSSTFPDWNSGLPGRVNGGGLEVTVTAFTPNTGADFMTRFVEFGSALLDPTGRRWSDITQVESYRRWVSYRDKLNGFMNGIKSGRGLEFLCYGTTAKNGHGDVFPIRSSTVYSANFVPTKAVTGITRANPGVVTVVGHGLRVGDNFRLTGVTGMVEANNDTNGIPAWAVSRVIDANTFEIGRNVQGNVGLPEQITPVDTSAWTARTGGGVCTGRLRNLVYFERVAGTKHSGNPYFESRHSDFAQGGSAQNDVSIDMHFRDCVMSVEVAPNRPNTTQALLGGGGETDSMVKRGEVTNCILIHSAPNGLIVPFTADDAFPVNYATDLRFIPITDVFGESTFQTAASRGMANGVISGKLITRGSANWEITNSQLVTPITQDYNAMFEGPFQQIGSYWYPVGLPTDGTAEEIITAYAAHYKTKGAWAGMGFGAHPQSPFFTGALDGITPTISGVAVTPGPYSSSANWSSNTGKAFVWWMVTSAALTGTEAQKRAAIIAGGGIASARLGLSASGAQAPISFAGLSPTTGYFIYFVAQSSQGVWGPVSETAFTSGALTDPTIEQAISVLVSSGNGSTYPSNSFTTGNAANRALVALVPVMVGTNTSNQTGTQVLLDGTPMTIVGSVGLAGSSTNGRTRILIAAAVGVAAGSHSITVNSRDAALAAVNGGGCTIDLFELGNVNQNIASWTFGSQDPGSATAASVSLAASANSLTLGAVCILGGTATASALGATNGATLVRENNTGATGTSDLKSGILTKAVASAGANSIGASWTGAADAVLAAVNIPKAA